MSSPASAEFLAAWRNKDQREAVTLVKIELTRPSPQTIYLSAREDVVTPGATPQPWQGGIIADIEPLDFPGELRASSWSPASGGFTLINGQFTAFQTGTDTVRDCFTDFGWMGAAVTFYLWEKSLTDFTKALAFTGFRVQDYELERWTVAVRVLQRWDWNREVQLKRVTRKKYPRAAEDALNQYIPKIRGAIRGPALREPFLNRYGDDQHGYELVRGATRATPGLVIDAGGGGAVPGTPTKIAFASHACKTFHDQTLGCMPMIAVDDKLCILDPDAGDVFNDSTDGAGFKVGDVTSAGVDPFGIAFYPMPAVNVELVAANNAQNPRAALDFANESNFAFLDYNAGYRTLYLKLPNVNPAGAAITNYLGVLYKSTGNMANVLFEVHDDIYGVLIITSAPAGSATPIFENKSTTTMPGPIDAGGQHPTWDYGEWTIRIRLTGAGGGNPQLWIYGVGMIVKFTPKREIISETARYIVRQGYKVRDAKSRDPGQRAPGQEDKYDAIYDRIFSPKGLKWFATIEGYADSGGTYTGSGTDLIERAPDILHHLLVEDGGEVTADVETGASTFGSFVDARALLKTWRQSDMVHALVSGAPERVSAAIQRLCDDAGIWVYLSEYDDKWKCTVWRTAPAVDYDFTVGIESIHAEMMKLRPTPATRRETVIEVPYAFDYFRGRPTEQAIIGPSRSAAGRRYFDLRDQLLSVYDSGDDRNDKIDFLYVAVQYTATLTAGDYTGTSLAAHVRTQMNATAAAVTFSVCYGPWVDANNDTIRLDNGGGPVTATIASSSYSTMEALATAATTALNAAGAGSDWTCSYSRTTRKFTISKAAGTASLYWSTAASSTREARTLLGFMAVDLTGSLSYLADYEREEELFAIGAEPLTDVFDLLWQTGTNGSDGTNQSAAILLGFDTAQDNTSTGATDVSFVGQAPKNNREQAIADITSAIESEQNPRRVRGETIYDDDTAREVRDRMTDLLCVDRPTPWLPLLDCPDLERGRVVGCHASLDRAMPYAVEGTDGSWAGKKLQCVAKRQHLAGSYMTEAFLVDVS